MQTGQAEKYTYAVLGAGRQGTAAAYDMAKFGNATKVTLWQVRIGTPEQDRDSTLCALEKENSEHVSWIEMLLDKT